MERIVYTLTENEFTELCFKLDKIADLLQALLNRDGVSKAELKAVLTKSECMEFLKVSKSTIRKYMRYEGLPYKILTDGGHPIFMMNEVLEWLKTR